MASALLATASVFLAVALGVGVAPAGSGEIKIPLCVGLTIGSAVREPRGDYEPLIVVDAVTPKSFSYTYSSQTATPSGSIRNMHARRTVLIEDLRSATMIMPWISQSSPISIPGSTSVRVSSAVFHALKTRGTADITTVDRQNAELSADRKVHPNVYEFAEKYTVRRVGDRPERAPVLVNGARAELPLIHAKGSYLGDTIELFILDDEDNPLALGIRMSSGPGGPVTAGQTVKISFRCSPESGVKAALSPIERALLATGRVDVYDLYFDFNSAALRDESEPTLREIGDLMRRHVDWKLSIEGHTDNIAGDQYNLDLSKRRAASVKTALVSRYQVDGSRLTTEGYGKSSPKDTNDTLEGRARNRRVELVRR